MGVNEEKEKKNINAAGAECWGKKGSGRSQGLLALGSCWGLPNSRVSNLLGTKGILGTWHLDAKSRQSCKP